MARFKLNDDDVRAALSWFEKQPQGKVFFSALQGVVEEIGPSETCALHAHNARRTFAANLIAMAEVGKSDEGETEGERRNGGGIPARRTLRRGPSARG